MDNLSGRKYGRWTVIKYSYSNSNYTSIWECVCECGIKRNVLSTKLKNGQSKSCGCLNIEVAKSKSKHGASKRGNPSNEYMAWSAMRARCYNEKCALHNNYGGRGIRVCDEWMNPDKGFINFLSSMGVRPSSKYSLDRIDNDGNYEPSNCRWALSKVQLRNTRRNKWLLINGERKVITDWASLWGIDYQKIQGAIKNGYTCEEIYKRFALKEIIKRKRRFYGNSNSRRIQVVENGVATREYNSISDAMKGESAAKCTILNHLRGSKYLYNKKTKEKKLVPVNYDNCKKIFKEVA